MDNGYPKGNTENPYFTAGEGNISPDVNAEPDNSLDEKEWQRALEISAPVDLPPIEAPTASPQLEPAKAGTFNTETPIELGQITPITPPIDSTKSETPSKYNSTNIRTTGDRLAKTSISEINSAINELNQTGNLSNFYDEIRGTDEKAGMMEANLHNSFGRKLGQEQGGN